MLDMIQLGAANLLRHERVVGGRMLRAVPIVGVTMLLSLLVGSWRTTALEATPRPVQRLVVFEILESRG